MRRAGQMVPAASPLFSLAWSERHRILAAGGRATLHIYQVEAAEALRLRHARAADAHAGFQRAQLFQLLPPLQRRFR